MKRYLRYFMFLLLSMSLLDSYSQTNLRDIGIISTDKKAKGENEVKVKKVKKTEPAVIVKHGLTQPDTVYCFQTTKRHGWFEPLGLLTKEQALKRSQSLMFTKRNSKGHWTKMESINAYGKYTPGGFSPYIVKIGSEKDSLKNEEWGDKLKGACIFEFIPDPSGENIIQERAFDKDYNLLYAYSRVPVGKNQFIGSYKDIYGLPAEMRNDSGYKYGTLVLITEDENGFDHRVEYIDAQRKNKPNADGSYAEMFDYNAKGELLIQYSVDSSGNKIKDVWGNCALIHTYDSVHLNKSSMYADENLKPMGMPSIEAGNMKGVVKVLFNNDDFFRLTEMKFVTENNNDTVNDYGCHRIVMEYDNHGNQLSATGYDLNSNLAVMDYTGTAKTTSKYDSLGNCLEIKFLDKEKKPLSSEDYLSKIEYEYDKGILISEKRWQSERGIEKLIYQYDNIIYPAYREEKTTWRDGTSEINRFDNKNREIMAAYYDAGGSRGYNPDKTWSYKTTDYIDLGNKKAQYVQCYYDPDGRLSQSENLEYNRKIAICDSISKEEFYRDYKNDFLINTFSKKFNDDYTSIIEQADNNVFGKITRVGGVSGVRHYNAKVKWTPFSAISYIVCKDEFDEPDYLVVDGGSIYYYQRSSAGGAVNMSAENEEIKAEDKNVFRDLLPKVISIEVVDSMAYKLGFRDNDVILLYGDYTVDLEETPSYYNFRRDWTLASIMEANKNSRMVVFRIEDAKNNKYGLIEISDLKGSLSELGVIGHIRYLTDRQKERIISSIEKDSIIGNAILTHKDHSKEAGDGGNNYVILSYPEMFRQYRDKPYPKHITDPAILLGACASDRDLYWTLKNGEDISAFNAILESQKSEQPGNHEINFFFTTDLNAIKPLEVKDEYASTTWFDTYVSDEVYETLLKLNKISTEKIDSINSTSPAFKGKSGKKGNDSHKHKVGIIKEKQIVGKWNTVITERELSVNLTLDFDKKRGVNMKYLLNAKGEISSGIIMNLDATITKNGKWLLNDDELITEMNDDSLEVIVDNVVFEGASEEQQKEFSEYLRDKESELLELITSGVAKSIPLKTIEINNISKNEMEVMIGGSKISFTKIKK